MKPIYLLWFLFGAVITSIAQQQNIFQDSLQMHNTLYIKGETAVIGNNIVSKHKTEAFNDQTIINDQLDMVYVDVDSDPETFSSSSANLQFPENSGKIVFAGLYWSAIYSYDKGVKRRSGNKIVYKGNKTRDSLVNFIKFKTPNNPYQNITGEILFDGYSIPGYNDFTPYVCYADVTHLLNKGEINGNYTVANIKATQGYISGGSAAGWLLYIVYETPIATPKYITTYKGFVPVNKKPYTVPFTNFKTPAEGNVEASITIAAIEGDSKLKRDKLVIQSLKDSTNHTFFTKNRDQDNFFNSTITVNDTSYTNRMPNSQNTLGFDLAKLKIPNPNNSVIRNGSTQTTLKFITKADRFHVFFSAFETEISEDLYIEKNQFASQSAFSGKAINNQQESSDLSKHIKPESLQIPNLEAGYYIITNVFSKQELATRWENQLQGKGYLPKTFINPENNWYYVFVYNTKEVQMAHEKLQKMQQSEPLKNAWIYKVNL